MKISDVLCVIAIFTMSVVMTYILLTGVLGA